MHANKLLRIKQNKSSKAKHAPFVSATLIGRRTLAQVIMQEDSAGLTQLLREGASASETDSHGWNPLHWASSRGSAVMTHIILQETKTSEESGEALIVYQYVLIIFSRKAYTYSPAAGVLYHIYHLKK